jgi:uncharacterized protein (TIGR00369 family)
MATQERRTRTITWEDPAAMARAARRMSGLDYLGAILRGDLPGPPIAATLGIVPAELAAGRVAFTLEPAEYHYNPLGAVNGGLTATLCDTALGCAIHSTLPAGTGYTTLELKVSYVRAITRETGIIRGEGRVLHVGGRVALAEARVTDAAGTLYAHATTTCLLLRPARSVSQRSGDGGPWGAPNDPVSVNMG